MGVNVSLGASQSFISGAWGLKTQVQELHIHGKYYGDKGKCKR